MATTQIPSWSLEGKVAVVTGSGNISLGFVHRSEKF
jgi:hypothetical protein